MADTRNRICLKRLSGNISMMKIGVSMKFSYRILRTIMAAVFMFSFVLSASNGLANWRNIETDNGAVANWVVDQWYIKYQFNEVEQKLARLPKKRLTKIRIYISNNNYVKQIVEFGSSAQQRNHNALMAWFKNKMDKITRYRLIVGHLIKCSSCGSELTNCIMQTDNRKRVKFSLGSSTAGNWMMMENRLTRGVKVKLYMPIEPKKYIALKLYLQ